MPKKFQGMNTKAVTAKARKADKLHSEQEQKQKEMEDAYWRDDNKNAKKKQQRKEAQENKRLETANKKKELQDLYDAEQKLLNKVSKSMSSSTKVTRAEINQLNRKEKEEQAEKQRAEALKKKNISVQNEEIEENINKLVIEGSEARTVEEAISVLGTSSEELDRHPERRLKSSYKKYEQERMPVLKLQNPDMRMSQLRQILRKEWQKSPDNPLNQKHLEYNDN